MCISQYSIHASSHLFSSAYPIQGQREGFDHIPAATGREAGLTLDRFSIPITTIWWIDKIFSRLMFLHCWRILHSHAIWRGLSPDLAGIRSPWHDAPYWVLTKTRSLAKLLLDTRSGKKINGADEWSSTGGGRASCEGLRGMLRRRLR